MALWMRVMLNMVEIAGTPLPLCTAGVNNDRSKLWWYVAHRLRELQESSAARALPWEVRECPTCPIPSNVSRCEKDEFMHKEM